MKKVIWGLVFIFSACSAWAEQNIAGFWKSINEDTGKAECVVAIYKYQNDYFGRMIGSYDSSGKMDDTIYNPKKRAPGVPGTPYYSGMDFIWDLLDRGSKYYGKILDPSKGDVYKAEVWVDGGKLVVRGKLMFFGRSQTWLPATKKDFPSNFKMPDTSKFVPIIPVDD